MTTRTHIDAASVTYRGVSITRPCQHCDTTSIHMDGLCQDGPCAICGVNKRVEQGWPSHPRKISGTFDAALSDEPLHDWAPHSYEPAIIGEHGHAFTQMLQQVKALGMPERYTSDLFRDYQILKARGPETDQRFIWVLRPNGTHMVYQGTNAEEAGQASGIVSYLKDNERGAVFFHWNGFGLEWVSVETAGVVLAVPRPEREGHTHGPSTMVCTRCAPEPEPDVATLVQQAINDLPTAPDVLSLVQRAINAIAEHDTTQDCDTVYMAEALGYLVEARALLQQAQAEEDDAPIQKWHGVKAPWREED